MKYALSFFILLCLLGQIFSVKAQQADTYWQQATSRTNYHRNQSNYEKALLFAEQARNIAKIHYQPSHERYSISLNNLGRIYYLIGRLDSAQVLYHQAQNIRQKHQQTFSIHYATTLSNLGVLERDQGNYERAQTQLLQSVKLIRELDMQQDSVYAPAISNLASLYQTVGKYHQAEILYQEALELSAPDAKQPHSSFSINLENLASLYAAMGQYDKAMEFYALTLDAQKQTLGRAHPNRIRTINSLAALFASQKNWDKAQKTWEDCLSLIERKFGKEHPEYAFILENLASLHLEKGEYSAAENRYRMALEIIQEEQGTQHPDYAICLNNMSIVLREQGKHDRAFQFADQAAQVMSQCMTPSQPEAISIKTNVAILYWEMKKLPEAVALMQEMNQLQVEAIRMLYPGLSEERKQQFLKKIHQHFDVFSSFVAREHEAYPELVGELMNLELATRSIGLQASQQFMESIYHSGNEALQAKFEELNAARRMLAQAYILSSNQKELHDLNEDSLRLQIRLLEEEIAAQAAIVLPEVFQSEVKWEQVQASLQKQEVAISFINFRKHNGIQFTDTTEYYALCLRPEWKNPRLHKLTQELKLYKLLHLPADIAGSYVENPNTSKALYDQIWKPLEADVKDAKNIHISVSGLLNKVSFYALQSSYTSLLIDHHQIQYHSSLRNLTQKREDVTIQQKDIVLVGGADYDLGRSHLRELAMSKTRSEGDFRYPSYAANNQLRGTKWNYLPGTKQEVQRMDSLFQENGWKSHLLIEEKALEDHVKAYSGDRAPRVLHIATHGYFFSKDTSEWEFYPINPRAIGNLLPYSPNPYIRSGLVLTGANQAWNEQQEIEGLEDGILTAYEVMGLDFRRTELVVLSACDTGLGDVSEREGVLGLQRAFKMAGAKSLIMSLWKVPDAQTSEMIEQFYAYYLSGMSKEEAFTKTQKEMRQKYEPYYWAAFVLVK